jgi:predicted dehydrogenase
MREDGVEVNAWKRIRSMEPGDRPNATASPSPPYAPSPKPTRLVQVGLGGWGSDWAANVVPLVRSAEFAGFVDSSVEARKRAETSLRLDAKRLFPTLAEAFEAIEAEGVVVVLPAVGHAPAAQAALEAGKHVLVEKPFTATLEEGMALIALAERLGRILMVSQNYRYHAAVMTAADLVARRTFGRPLSATIEFRQDWKAAGHRYHDIPGPLLLDMGIHHFDMVRMIFGEEVARVACRSWNTPYSPFGDHAAAQALLELQSGIVVSYHGSWLRRGVPTTWSGEWAIECEEGELLFAARPGPVAPAHAGKLFLRRATGKTEELATNPVHAEDRAGTLDAFVRAIRSGREPPFFPSARDNIRSLATSFACMRSSAEDGRWVAPSDLLA